MKIYIPTRNRPYEQPTYRQLYHAGLNPVLVVDKSDPAQYDDFEHIRIDVKGLAPKRQWIMNNAGPKFAMLDDDIMFHHVSKDGRIGEMTHIRLYKLFTTEIPKLLDRYAHGRIHARFWIVASIKHRYPYTATRGFNRQATFFNRALFKRKVQYETGLDGSEDMWAHLQLCMQGLDWFVYNGCAYSEVRAKALPEHWTMEHKERMMNKIRPRIDPEFINKRNTILFRKLAIAHGAKGK